MSRLSTMASEWRYRLAGILGTGGLTAGAVVLANGASVQRLAVALPLLDRLPPTTLRQDGLALAVATAVVVVVVAVAPLFKPRPRRVLDVLAEAERRVFVALVALAAVGYFDYTYRLPRTTLVVTGAVLAVVLPAWFVLIRPDPRVDSNRAVVVGDDPAAIEEVLESSSLPVLGYVSPPSSPLDAPDRERPVSAPDGGRVVEAEDHRSGLDCLGGLSRLEEVLVGHNVDTALLAFSRPDRAEFFGALDALYRHGVTAKVHRDHADTVLTTEVGTGDLVDVDLEPWDPQDHALKRAFDVGFAVVGLVTLAPVMAFVALAILVDDGPPVLYSQSRTAEFGDTFTVHKFRTMLPESEDADPVDDDENDRITRLGRFLRATHLDELPQLWSVLTGEMSVVGPRAAWVDEETRLELEASAWRKRWFVKPGLTGLAQIHDVTSTDPETKLRHDVVYIRNQSFWFDLRILLRQLWLVLVDGLRALRGAR